MEKGSKQRAAGATPGILKDIDRMIDVVGRGWELLSAGRRAEKVRAAISDQVEKESDADLVMDILFTRKRSKGKFTNWERLYFTSSGLRWATPEVAAEHCARRMECERIADLACGQGGQIIAFSSRCSEVVAIDKDPFNLFIANLNWVERERSGLGSAVSCTIVPASYHGPPGTIAIDPATGATTGTTSVVSSYCVVNCAWNVVSPAGTT